VLIGVALVPQLQTRAKALGLLLEALGADVPRPLAPDVIRREVLLDGVVGDVYLPGTPSPPVVLVHGAAPLGKDDPRLVRLARSVARAGRVVFVPQLELAERRFAQADLDRIVRGTIALQGATRTEGDAVLLGISYGGSLALVASADPRLRDRLAQVAVFGAYFDLVGVIQAVTTGVSLVDGREFPWEGPPQARSILERVAVELAPRTSRTELAGALDAGDPTGLSPDGLALYEVLVNRDPKRTETLAADLPPEVLDVFQRFSPSSVAEDIAAPVTAMHSLSDPAVPFGEVARLANALPEARTVVVRGFRHVDFSSTGDVGSTIGDLRGSWRFSTWLLEAQE
jgi:pimeloyl-ACP methyl ester carboxylesterase